MNHDFLTIGFTLPEFFDGEAERIVRLLDTDIDLVHIRKPGAARDDMSRLIQAIPALYHPRLRIHDHFDLLNEFALGGVHLNSRNPEAPADCPSVTRSCHSLQELTMPLPDGSMPQYQTLSPIFDSISKPGYASRFNPMELTPIIKGMNVVALGGVTPDKLPLLRQAGFRGAAMLGCLWTQP